MIKPAAWMCDGKINQAGYVSTDKTAIDVAHALDGFGPLIALYAIPDTHCIMPVKLTGKLIAAALPVLMREDDEDKYRALGQLICVWDELVEAVKEEQP